jgi:hypothetical protein
MFVIHQTATSLQRTDNLNPRIEWYTALDESNRMKSAYFAIHLGKNPPPQNDCRLRSVLFLKAPVSHPPFSQFNRTFHKTNRPPWYEIPVLPGHWPSRILRPRPSQVHFTLEGEGLQTGPQRNCHGWKLHMTNYGWCFMICRICIRFASKRWA